MTATKLFSVQIQATHKPTGRTVHTKDGTVLPAPTSLEIVHDHGDAGFTLYYLDETGQPQTDTWHLSLDDAFHQAQFEFGVLPEHWVAEPE